MTIIDNGFGKSISEMSDEEIVELMRKMRASRRTAKQPAKKATKDKPITIINLSDPQKANLLAELEDMLRERES